MEIWIKNPVPSPKVKFFASIFDFCRCGIHVWHLRRWGFGISQVAKHDVLIDWQHAGAISAVFEVNLQIGCGRIQLTTHSFSAFLFGGSDLVRFCDWKQIGSAVSCILQDTPIRYRGKRPSDRRMRVTFSLALSRASCAETSPTIALFTSRPIASITWKVPG